TLTFFQMRACYSGRVYVRAVARATQQAFLECMAAAFAYFGGYVGDFVNPVAVKRGWGVRGEGVEQPVNLWIPARDDMRDVPDDIAFSGLLEHYLRAGGVVCPGVVASVPGRQPGGRRQSSRWRGGPSRAWSKPLPARRAGVNPRMRRLVAGGRGADFCVADAQGRVG